MNIPFSLPWITEKDRDCVNNSLKQQWLTNGPILKKFENDTSRFLHVKYALGVSNGSIALDLALKSIGVKPRDEVILPTFTYVATEAAVVHCGATPKMVDVDKETFNISPKLIEDQITKKTKAIICVHYGGQSCDMNEIIKIAKKHDLKIIEDCAHAFGSTYKKKKCGTMGEIGCFSFYPTKMITTIEGGMITTNNKNYFNEILLTRNNGISISSYDREHKGSWKYNIDKIGFNARLDDVRSALGLSQLSRINEIIRRRKKLAREYDKRLKRMEGITIPKINSDCDHVYHLYTIKVEDAFHMTRDQLFQKLHKNGIRAGVLYYPLHLMNYNKKKYSKSNFKNSDYLKDRILCLPIFPTMTIKQIEKVVSVIER